MTYDAFISYSHAADGLLAPRLQSALQRFAKPWWQRRAIRVFRDEASLAANPHLWSSITDALDASEWFVLLLSPDAARSPWVDDEVAYWLEHKDKARILPVVTEGEFGPDILPPALTFDDEPRWVDLRFARTDEQLDLKNPSFSAAIADIASAVRSVPKDELEGEEVRQHRRTVRTAWAAGSLVATLAMLAVVFAAQSAQNASEADRLAALESTARIEAEQNESEAIRQTGIAEQNAAEANRQEDLASATASLAKARELAASAISASDNPELAILLSLQALDEAPPDSGHFPEGLISLRRALAENRLIGRATYPHTDAVSVAFSANSSSVVVSHSSTQAVERLNVDDLSAPDWTFHDPETQDRFTQVDVSPDGRYVTVIVLNTAIDDGRPGRVLLLDATSGELASTLPLGECEQPMFFFGVGSHFAVSGTLYGLGIEATECAADPTWWGWVFFDTSTWTEVDRFARAHVSMSNDGSLALVSPNSPEPGELRTYPGGQLVAVVDVDAGRALTPDGSTIVFRYPNGVDLRPGFWNVDSQTLIDRGDGFTGFNLGYWFDQQGRALILSSESDIVYETGTGLKVAELPNALSVDGAISPDGHLAVTGSLDGRIELWTLESIGTGRVLSEISNGADWINPDAIG